MDDSNDSPAAVLTGKIMIAAVMVLFMVIVFILCLHLYARWFWRQVDEADRNPFQGRSRRQHRRRFVFTPGQELAISTIHGRGLEPAILESIPVLVYNQEEFNGLECAVCLFELENGEKARLLPKCNHGFHVDCIDMWFQSHSTCPLCRNPVAPVSSNSSAVAGANVGAQDIQMPEENMASESPMFPTNVLVWGNQTQVSSAGACLEEGSSQPPAASSSSSSSTSTSVVNGVKPDGMLVIDIPSEMINPPSSSPSTAARFADDELKSPMTTRLRSLKRLLSRDKKSSPCSPNSVDLEQATRGHN